MSWEDDQDAAVKRMLAGFRLPEPRDPRDETAFRGAGGRIETYGLLRRVLLPRGWTVRQTDLYHGELLDEQGRLRGTFYYNHGGGLKAITAWLAMERRYTTYSGSSHWIAWDSATDIVLYDPETDDLPGSHTLVQRWLNAHYPNWEDPYHYWAGMLPRWKIWQWKEL